MKIKNKITLLFLLLAAGSTVASAIVFYVSGKNAILGRVEAQLASIAELKTQSLNHILETSKKTVEAAAALDEVKNYTASRDDAVKDEVRRLLNDKKFDSHIAEFFIFDPDGKIIFSTDASQEGKIRSDSEYFIEGKKRTFVQSFYFSTALLKPATTAATPVKDTGGNVIGVLAGWIGEKDIDEATAQVTGLGSTGETFLVNKFNYVVTGLQMQKYEPFQKQIYTEAIEKCLTGVSGFGSFIDYRNVPALISYRWLPEENVCLEVKIDQAEANKPIVELRSIIIGLGVFIMVIIVILSFLFTGLFVGPLQELKVFAGVVGAGDFSRRIKIKSKDEIGELAVSFNKMVDDISLLKAEQVDILQRQKETLEQEVQKRTGELQIKITEAERMRAILYSLSEDIKKEKESVDQKIIERTKELGQEHGRMRSLLESVKLGVVMLDLNSNVLSANAAAREILGKKPEENVDFKDLEKSLESIDPAHNLNYYIEEKKAVDIQEAKFKDKYYRLFLSPVHDAERKEVIGSVIVIEDITAAKLVDQMRTDIISVTSHQLRTPLTAIKWYVETLQDEKLTKKQKEYLFEIYHSNERMIKLISALLNVSRIDTGMFTIAPKPEDMIEIAKIVVDNLAPQIKNKKIKFTAAYGADLPKINIDARLLQIVFENLLSNAVKYTPEGGVVSLNIARDKRNALIKVSDSGYGIPKEAQPHVYEKFFRADNIKVKDPEGTGLGLYMARAIVEQSGGKIWFESPARQSPDGASRMAGGEENKGTTFYVSMPLSGMKKKNGTKELTSAQPAAPPTAGV